MGSALLAAALASPAAARIPADAPADNPALPATIQAAALPLPAGLADALAQVQDFGYSFDSPAFYGLLAWIRAHPDSVGPGAHALPVEDWRQLQERPGDFRGRVIAIEGRVGRNKDPFISARYPELGEIYQMELHRADQPLALTVCSTQNVSDIPVGARIRLHGIFLMMRSYDAPGGRVRRSAVVVARGPSLVEAATDRGPIRATGLDWRWLTGALVVGLLATYIVLRRAGGPGRTDVRTLRASHPAPLDLSAELTHWPDPAAEEPPRAEREPPAG